MKKLIISIMAVAVVCGFSMRAQAQDYDHELGLSYGVFSTSNWLDGFDDVTIITTSAGKIAFDKGSFIGPIALEYFYRINPLVGVGAIGIYGNCKTDFISDKAIIGKETNSYFTVLPAVKLDWFRRSNFGLYSKIGAGITIRNEKADFTNDKGEKQNASDTGVHFNWQMSILGVEFGSSIRGFVELGCGEQGVALAGIRFRL